MKNSEKTPEMPNNEADKLANIVEEQQKTIQEYTNTLQRLQADFDNHIKRTKKEKEELEKYATAKVAAKLLNVLDDFERTQKIVLESQDKRLVQGIEMIQKQMSKILEEEGIKPIHSKGQKFDPYKHEIIDIKKGEEDDKVIEEVQKGYTIHDKVLRTSKVIVSRKEE